MKTYLPIKVKSSPIRKLAIIPFEKNPDTIYHAFELQYFNGEPYGTGYRVLAARNDGFVDVYDDKALNFMENEQFQVTENGLQEIVVRFEDNHVRIAFGKGLDLSQECNGIFTIRPREQMGYIQGEYRVVQGTQTEINMVPTIGWVPKPTSLFLRTLFNQKSVFCSWSRKYEYRAIIDWNKRKITSNWQNGNIRED